MLKVNEPGLTTNEPPVLTIATPFNAAPVAFNVIWPTSGYINETVAVPVASKGRLKKVPGEEVLTEALLTLTRLAPVVGFMYEVKRLTGCVVDENAATHVDAVAPCFTACMVTSVLFTPASRFGTEMTKPAPAKVNEQLVVPAVVFAQVVAGVAEGVGEAVAPNVTVEALLLETDPVAVPVVPVLTTAPPGDRVTLAPPVK